MDIRELHYSFKMKMNKIDSNQNRSFLIPEIDFLLNEAQLLFTEWCYNPRRIPLKSGFEVNQGMIDDLQAITVNELLVPTIFIDIDNTKYIEATFPIDYLHFIRAHLIAEINECPLKEYRIFIKQHDDIIKSDPFQKSSATWGEAAAEIRGKKIRIMGSSDFDFDGLSSSSKVNLIYIKKPDFIHNAADWSVNGYNDINGNLLTGRVNPEFPDQSCIKIVDIAVMIAAGSILTPNYQTAIQKFSFNNSQ